MEEKVEFPRLFLDKRIKYYQKRRKKQPWPFNTIHSLFENEERTKKRVARRKMKTTLTPMEKYSRYLVQQQPLDVRYHNNNRTPELSYAATQIQRVWRGAVSRTKLWSSNGAIAHACATRIQCMMRKRWAIKKTQLLRQATEINSANRIRQWWLYQLFREKKLLERAAQVTRGMIAFQAVYRGLVARKRVCEIRRAIHSSCAVKIQSVIRGFLARRRVGAIIQERRKMYQHLERISVIHQYLSRCGRCNIKTSTEKSLIDCIMARHLGLHDFPGAKVLCCDGMQKFPHSPKFTLLYAVLLFVTCEELELAMAYLDKTKVLARERYDSEQSWFTDIQDRYFFFALEIWPGDAAVLLDYAVFLQCTGQIHRASLMYKLVLPLSPSTYNIPGYLNRKHMSFRIIQNYTIFLSLFKLSQEKLATADLTLDRNLKARLSIWKCHHYVAIRPDIQDNSIILNNIYLTQDELSVVMRELNKGYGIPRARRSDQRRNAVGRGGSQTFDALFNDIQAQQEKYRRRGQTIIIPSDVQKFIEGKSTKRISKQVGIDIIKTVVLLRKSDSLRTGVLMIPLIAKLRQFTSWKKSMENTAIEIQRVFRGWRLRCERLRERMFEQVRCLQLNKLQQRLEKTRLYREKRYASATAIQAIVRGRQTRAYLQGLHSAAVFIQCMIRSHQARARVRSLRIQGKVVADVELIRFRGHVVSDRPMMLKIEKVSNLSDTSQVIYI